MGIQWYKDVVYDFSVSEKGQYTWIEYEWRIQNWAVFHRAIVHAADRNYQPNPRDPDRGYVKKENIYTSRWHDKESQCRDEINDKLAIHLDRERVIHERAIKISVPIPLPFFNRLKSTGVFKNNEQTDESSQMVSKL